MSSDVGKSVLERILDGVGRFAGRAQERRPLATDLLENDDAYLVVFDAPDASAQDVQVRFSERAVHVRIDRKREHREGFEMRFPGRGLSLDGSVRLPTEATVDPDDATATLTAEGTLEIELPKVEGTDDGPIRISTDESETVADEAVEDIDDADEGTAVDDESESANDTN